MAFYSYVLMIWLFLVSLIDLAIHISWIGCKSKQIWCKVWKSSLERQIIYLESFLSTLTSTSATPFTARWTQRPILIWLRLILSAPCCSSKRTIFPWRLTIATPWSTERSRAQKQETIKRVTCWQCLWIPTSKTTVISETASILV